MEKQELLRLRPIVQAEKQRKSSETKFVKNKPSRDGVLANILIELRAIRSLLEAPR